MKHAASAAERPKQYNAVVASARLARLSLVTNEFRIFPEFASTDEKDRTLSYGGDLVECTFDETTGTVSGLLSWWVEARNGKKVTLRCASQYGIQYDGLTGHNADAARVFLERVGRFATYPYFRALTAQMSWESSAGLPPMPVLREGTPGSEATREVAPKTAKRA